MRLLRSSAVSAAVVSSLLCGSVPLQARDLEKPDGSGASVQQSPKVLAPAGELPGLTKQPERGGGVIAPRTHCNGTCMCSGSDCTQKWIAKNCKGGEATCSGAPGEYPVCSCIRKAAAK